MGTNYPRRDQKMCMGFFHYLINIEHENAKRMLKLHKKKKYRSKRRLRIKTFNRPKLPEF